MDVRGAGDLSRGPESIAALIHQTPHQYSAMFRLSNKPPTQGLARLFLLIDSFATHPIFRVVGNERHALLAKIRRIGRRHLHLPYNRLVFDNAHVRGSLARTLLSTSWLLSKRSRPTHVPCLT